MHHNILWSNALKSKLIYIVFALIFAALAYTLYRRSAEYVPHYTFWQIDLLSTEKFTEIAGSHPQNIWLIGASGSVFKSVDSGDSWSRMRQPDGTALQDVFFLDENNGWVAGGNGIVLTTQSGGKTWSTQDLGDVDAMFDAVWFFDEHNGLLAGGKINQPETSLLYETSDGGENWVKHVFSTEPPDYISGLFFFTSDSGLGFTTTGLMRTENGGKSWEFKRFDNGFQFHNFFFVDPLTGWAASEKGGIYKTIDGAETWSESKNAESYTIHDIFFIDENRGWAVGDDGVFLYSMSGGESWTRMDTGVDDTLLSVHFFNPDFGLICGENGIVILVETEQF